MEARQGQFFGYLPYPTALTGPCQQTAADLVAARCLQPPITAALRRPGFKVEIANMEIMQICAKHAHLGYTTPC
jgi:hypothetical protein